MKSEKNEEAAQGKNSNAWSIGSNIKVLEKCFSLEQEVKNTFLEFLSLFQEIDGRLCFHLLPKTEDVNSIQKLLVKINQLHQLHSLSSKDEEVSMQINDFFDYFWRYHFHESVKFIALNDDLCQDKKIEEELPTMQFLFNQFLLKEVKSPNKPFDLIGTELALRTMENFLFDVLFCCAWGRFDMIATLFPNRKDFFAFVWNQDLSSKAKLSLLDSIWRCQ